MAAAPKFDLLRRYGSVAGLRAAMQEDPSIKTEVGAELVAVQAIKADRCVISKEYRDALVEALT